MFDDREKAVMMQDETRDTSSRHVIANNASSTVHDTTKETTKNFIT
jgi:hypothetical protein